MEQLTNDNKRAKQMWIPNICVSFYLVVWRQQYYYYHFVNCVVAAKMFESNIPNAKILKQRSFSCCTLNLRKFAILTAIVKRRRFLYYFIAANCWHISWLPLNSIYTINKYKFQYGVNVFLAKLMKRLCEEWIVNLCVWGARARAFRWKRNWNKPLLILKV